MTEIKTIEGGQKDALFRRAKKKSDPSGNPDHLQTNLFSTI